jgi:hypothetical protein
MRIRLHDLSLSIWTQLNDLPYPAYLLSMAVIGKQLAEIYADQFPEKGRLLARKTVDAVKTAYLSGEAAADDAWQLHLGWQQWLYDVDDPDNEADGSAEMFSAMITFDLLAMELAGKTPPRTALDQVTNAAELPDPRFPAPAEPRLVQIVPAEDWAEEDSPAVQLMRNFEEVARLAARQHNTGLLCDPDQFYSIAFG